MSFDNHYPKRKDWREPYRRSKAFDRSCRNHGGCSWCEGNRTIDKARVIAQARDALAEIETGDQDA